MCKGIKLTCCPEALREDRGVYNIDLWVHLTFRFFGGKEMMTVYDGKVMLEEMECEKDYSGLG